MTTIQEIETAIDKLPRGQLFELVEWIRARFADAWDRQIDDDLRAGKLDEMAREAVAEYRAGRTTPFPPDEEPRD
jgi:hypothetical protein